MLNLDADGLQAPDRLVRLAGLSVGPLTSSCSCFGADFRRLRTELSLEVRFNKGVHKFRPAQSEQALPAAGGHITSFYGSTGVQLVVRPLTATG
jgi:hypothetical protein